MLAHIAIFSAVKSGWANRVLAAPSAPTSIAGQCSSIGPATGCIGVPAELIQAANLQPRPDNVTTKSTPNTRHSELI